MTEPTFSLYLYSIYSYSMKAGFHPLHIINKTLFTVCLGTSLKGIIPSSTFQIFLKNLPNDHLYRNIVIITKGPIHFLKTMGKIQFWDIVRTASTYLSGVAAPNTRANLDPICAGETQRLMLLLQFVIYPSFTKRTLSLQTTQSNNNILCFIGWFYDELQYSASQCNIHISDIFALLYWYTTVWYTDTLAFSLKSVVSRPSLISDVWAWIVVVYL